MSSCDVRVTRQRGFTYMGVLLGVALIGVGLSVMATVWGKEAERQRKAEAEWVLAQYEKALRSYYKASPGSVKTLPATLDDLLADPRHLGVVRHLRKDYEVSCSEGMMTTVQYRVSFPVVDLLLACPSDEKVLAERKVVFALAT